ncbi:MAG: hypothetical protein ACFFAO_17805 [Candidatus Hermodarchaeota archaeon]
MTEESNKFPNNNSEKEVIKEEAKLQFHWYMVAFFTIFTLSFLIPGILFAFYLKFIFTPYFLETNNFTSLFTNLNSLLAMLLMPIVGIVCYLIHLFLVALITRILWRSTQKKSPTKSGIIPRNIPSKTLNYYHIRSFMIKYPRNAFIKGPFPWLINWFSNFVGTCKIGKGTTIEEQFAADRNLIIGKNCYFGVNGGLVTHTVEGIFGNIAYFEVRVGDNVTGSSVAGIAPGSVINDNSYLLPVAACTKHSIIKGKDSFYFGAPMRKIFKKKIVEYLKLTEDDLEKNTEMMKKYQEQKENMDESIEMLKKNNID